MSEVASHVFVIAWRDGFKIHIPEIDQEHRRLFELVAGLQLGTIDDTVEELLDYVVTHFTHEQQLMEQSGYPDFGEHLRLHEQFGANVADFLSQNDEWNEARVQDLRKFLNRWLVGHIMTHDLRFGNWYRDHKARAAALIQELSEPPVEAAPAAPPRKRGFFDWLLGRR
jgi:hemerythrin